MINTVALSGNLTKDPALKSTQSGSTVLQFSIAVNERVKKGGEWTDYANYFDCVMFGSRAEAISKYISKGSHVTVIGRLHQNRWAKDDGEKRSAIQIYVDEIDFIPQRKESNSEVYDTDEIPF